MTPYDLPEFRGGVDMARYAAEHRYMYSGEPVRVTLRMPISAAGQVYDAFGHYAQMIPNEDGKTMEVRLRSSLENMRFFACSTRASARCSRPRSCASRSARTCCASRSAMPTPQLEWKTGPERFGDPFSCVGNQARET